MTIAILGCGPTGLAAAHMCAARGIEYHIFSKRRKSFLYGSQYLHEPIPGITREEDHAWVKYVNYGTPTEYRRKTHGKYWDGIVAPEDFETDHPAWNIRAAYDRLWMRHFHAVRNREFRDYEQLTHDVPIDLYTLVISSVPRNLWRVDGEEFVYSEGWALGDAPEHGIFVPFDCEDNTIICDGTDLVTFNRLSCVFGYKTVEWPAHADVVDITTTLNLAPTRFVKPLRYDAHGAYNPVNEENWLHVGRYGEWRKGVVVTDAMHTVANKLEELGL